MDVNFYLIDWSKVEKKLFYKDFISYIGQNPSGEYNFTKPKETDWIEYVPLPVDWSEYVSDSDFWQWMESEIPLPKIIEKWDSSFEASSCFDENRLKLSQPIRDEFFYIIELTFYATYYDNLFPDYPEEYTDHNKIRHKIISPVRTAVTLSLWESRDYLSELQKVYEQPEGNRRVTSFEAFAEYMKAWIGLFERAYAKPGWGILVYF